MTQKQILLIAESTDTNQSSVKNTIILLDEGGTVPFIARYRKEKTGSLDEVQILNIKKEYEKLQEADKRRIAIIKSIEEQGLMTPHLLNKLNEANYTNQLEDIYLPFKPKKKTKASVAIENGLEPLAKMIFDQKDKDVITIAGKYLNNNITSIEDALSGARDIIAEWINEDIEARVRIRNIYEKEAFLISEIKKNKEIEGEKYKDYFEYNETLKTVPSHRYLAVKRGETEGFLKVKIEIEIDNAKNILERLYLKGFPDPKEQVTLAIEDSLKRLLMPSISKEYDNKIKEKSDKAAIDIFSINLKQLLLAAPLGQKNVLSIDPGFRTGCKTVVLSQTGELLYDTVIYPLFKEQEASDTIFKLCEKFKIEAIAIGNGTASRETESFVKKTFKTTKLDIKVFVVSEQGASIYSASDVAREEFPNKDLTVRGAVSIGRRLMDPLAELVKLDPKSIGVGQYQHDVDQKSLKETLDQVVEHCVNTVGVELNTASKHLLSYVSGIGPVLAQNIVDYRNNQGMFKDRNELKKVPRLGAKVYEQAAGFLRIREGKNPLDNSSVHPESYDIIKQISKDTKLEISKLLQNSNLKNIIDLRKYVNDKVGLPTLTDIIKELEKPGRDPREQIETFEFANVNDISDLREGMVLPGIVTNITAFGCFVDVGVHQDGLVHLSQMANRFIKDPNEIVKVHQRVNVRVMEVDTKRKRIGLSMKD